MAGSDKGLVSVRRGLSRRAPSPRARSSGSRSFLRAQPFLSPSLFGVIVFLLIPVVLVFVISLLNWNVLSPATWAGFSNYINIFRFDQAAHSLGITAYYVLLNIPLQTVVALSMAVALHRGWRGWGCTGSCSSPWLLVDAGGHGRHLVLGLRPATRCRQYRARPYRHPWSPVVTFLRSALPVVAVVNIWQYVGYNMLFFLAGLQAVPKELYEAADLDGANRFQQFFRISFPLLNSTLLFVLVTGVIGSFQVFDTLYVLTQGGPGNSTEVLNLQIHQLTFTDFKMGAAAAMSVLLFGVILIFSLGQFMFFRNRTTYEYSV